MHSACTHVIVSPPVASGGHGVVVLYLVMVGQLTLFQANAPVLMVARAS